MGVLELLWLVFTGVSAWLRPRHDLVAENLLLRHQLAHRPGSTGVVCYKPPLGRWDRGGTANWHLHPSL